MIGRPPILTLTYTTFPYTVLFRTSGETEKGDALKTTRVASILAAKRTDELIPLCHPLPIYQADVLFELGEDRVKIIAKVETIAPTGVEMEADRKSTRLNSSH